MKANRCSCGKEAVLERNYAMEKPRYYVRCDKGTQHGKFHCSQYCYSEGDALFDWNSKHDGWVRCNAAMPPKEFETKLMLVELTYLSDNSKTWGQAMWLEGQFYITSMTEKDVEDFHVIVTAWTDTPVLRDLPELPKENCR